jgi:hypothetical protein
MISAQIQIGVVTTEQAATAGACGVGGEQVGEDKAQGGELRLERCFFL